MPNYLQVGTNEVENGYMYKHLNNRMNILEKDFKEINNLLKNLDIKGDTINLKNLMIKIDSKVDRSALEYHTNDDRLHVSGEMKTFMESGNFVSRKFSRLYQPNTANMPVTHNLKSNAIVTSILDVDSGYYINRKIRTTSLNSIEIEFTSDDINKNFLVTIIS